MTIKITEAIVSGYRPLKYGVNITLNIKDEDLTENDKKLLENFWKTGDSLACVFQEFQKEKVCKENKLGTLHFLMEKYCEKENINIETEKQRLYKKYGIKSRAFLTKEQIDFEIESYKAGLQF